MTSRRTRAVSPEEFDQKIAELADMARAAGASLATDAESIEGAPQFDRAESLLEDALRISLEDEVIPAMPIQSGGIEQSELGRELTKKALVGLKIATLRKIARAKGTLVGGSIEELATRVAKAYEWDQAEIARLVLANEDEPSIERGHVSRLFPLAESYLPAEANKRVQAMSGRYIRIGVARWFLFDAVDLSAEVLDITGTYKSYKASIDGFQQEASLHAEPHDARVRVHLDCSEVLHVSGAPLPPSRGAVRAFEFVAGVAPLGYVPFADPRASGITGSLHPVSAFLLDVVFNRLAHSVFSGLNLTVARFKLRADDQGQEVDEGEAESRSELKAVRFEGSHLLDSAVACRLLALEGRPLVEVSFLATIPSEEGRSGGRFPVRVSVERDHVAVQTGLGSGEHEVSSLVHRVVLDAVTGAINSGVMNSDRLATLFAEMKVKAESPVDSVGRVSD